MKGFILRKQIFISKENYRRIFKMVFDGYPDDEFMKHLEAKQKKDGDLHKVCDNFEDLIQIFFEIGVETVWSVHQKDPFVNVCLT